MGSNLAKLPSVADAALALDDYLPYRLSVASNAVSRLIARAYEDRFGLTIPQWRLMAVLAEGALTQQAIVAKTAMDKVTVSRAAQGLVTRHLIARAAHEADAEEQQRQRARPGDQPQQQPVVVDCHRFRCAPARRSAGVG